MTLDRSRLDFARVKVGGRRREAIPSKLEVVIDGRLASLIIEVEEESIQKNPQKKLTFSYDASMGGAQPSSQARGAERRLETDDSKAKTLRQTKVRSAEPLQAVKGDAQPNPNLVCNQDELRMEAEIRRRKGKDLDIDPIYMLTSTREETAQSLSPRFVRSGGAGGSSQREEEGARGTREELVMGTGPHESHKPEGVGLVSMGLGQPMEGGL